MKEGKVPLKECQAITKGRIVAGRCVAGKTVETQAKNGSG